MYISKHIYEGKPDGVGNLTSTGAMIKSPSHPSFGQESAEKPPFFGDSRVEATNIFSWNQVEVG